MSGYLRSSVGTYTFAYADERAKPIYNSNVSTTIGGVLKKQTDSVRLEITLKLRVMQSDLSNLTAILNDFSSELYYYPTRLLWDRSTRSETTVVFVNSPDPETMIKEDEKGWYINIQLQEVIEQ